MWNYYQQNVEYKMDTLDGMKVFVRVVEEGGFTKAARRIGISPALASKYVGQLEERLGVRLLNRTTRRLSPTEVGQAYYSRCVPLLEDVEELEESVTRQHAEPRGVLRVAGPRAFGEEHLVAAVADFMVTYPQITVDLLLDERMVDIVAEGFDVAIRMAELKDSALIARRITDYSFFIGATPEYIERKGLPESPADLLQHDCILTTPVSPTAHWRFRMDGEMLSQPVRVRARVNTAQATETMIAAGAGIGFCRYSTRAADLKEGRLVQILSPYSAYDRNIYAVYPHSRHLSGKVRLFVDSLLTRFAAR